MEQNKKKFVFRTIIKLSHYETIKPRSVILAEKVKPELVKFYKENNIEESTAEIVNQNSFEMVEVTLEVRIGIELTIIATNYDNKKELDEAERIKHFVDNLETI